MQNKFNQPVSMQVTKEQYERDLREPLLRMGYLEYATGEWVAAPILVTNYANTGFYISNTINEHKKRYNRYFIPDYNPEFFLAIAAMSNMKYGIYGEWWYCLKDVRMVSDGRIEYNKGKLYMGMDNERIVDNSRDDDHYWRGDNRFEHFRKATLQELIEKFTNQKQDIMKEITNEQFNELKNLIAPENVEKFNKLFKVNKNAIKVDLNFNDMLESLDTPFRIADAAFMGIKEFAPYKNHYQKKSLVVSGQYNIDFVTIRGGHTLIMFNEKD